MTIKSLSHSSLTDNLFYRSMLAGNTAYEPPLVPFDAYDLLASEELSSSSTSIEFTNISTYSSGYDSLVFRTVLKANNNSPNRVFSMRVGSGGSLEAGSSYSWHILEDNGAVEASAGTSDNIWKFGNTLPHSGLTNQYGAYIIELNGLWDSNKKTTMKGWGGAVESRLAMVSGLWNNTSSITNIGFSAGGGYDLSLGAGSRISMYGLKASA